MNTFKEKLQSPVVWLALVALVFVVLKHLCGFDAMGAVDEVAEVLMRLIAAFGILNNPNNRSGF